MREARESTALTLAGLCNLPRSALSEIEGAPECHRPHPSAAGWGERVRGRYSIHPEIRVGSAARPPERPGITGTYSSSLTRFADLDAWRQYVITYVVTSDYRGVDMATNTFDFPTFKASPSQIGNGKGYRIAAQFFHEHPDLVEGDYEAACLGEGVVLIRRASSARTPASADVDPVMSAYLAWTEQAMRRDPALLRPMTSREFEVAAALVEGVAIDLEHDRLPDSFDLP